METWTLEKDAAALKHSFPPLLSLPLQWRLSLQHPCLEKDNKVRWELLLPSVLSLDVRVLPADYFVHMFMKVSKGEV